MKFFKFLDLIFVFVLKPKTDLLRISYILYLIQVEQQLLEVLIDLGIKTKTINPDFLKTLDLQVYETKVSTHKIDGPKLDIFV